MTRVNRTMLVTAVCAVYARRTKRNAINAINTWVRTAFSEMPMKRLIFRFCLIQRKNSSMAQRRL